MMLEDVKTDLLDPMKLLQQLLYIMLIILVLFSALNPKRQISKVKTKKKLEIPILKMSNTMLRPQKQTWRPRDDPTTAANDDSGNEAIEEDDPSLSKMNPTLEPQVGPSLSLAGIRETLNLR